MGDLTFHNWRKGKTSLCSSDAWEVTTQTGQATLVHRDTGATVGLDISYGTRQDLNFAINQSFYFYPSDLEDKESNLEVQHQGKKKGKKDPKENRSSKTWTEIKTDRDSGMRIMLWDLYRSKQAKTIWKYILLIRHFKPKE